MPKSDVHTVPLTQSIATEKDLPFIRDLLGRARLPLDIIEDRKGVLWAFSRDRQRVGCGALEFYRNDALLRSVAVEEAERRVGTGSVMVDLLEKEAAARGVRTVWLLTETAERFFARKGYRTVDRSEVVNRNLLDSAEFTHLCASTAVCMRKRLGIRDEKGET